MHKHKTADGRIVIHAHPYNLSKDSDATKHHHTETEIHLLDVIFQGSYTQPSCIVFDFSLALHFVIPFNVGQHIYYTHEPFQYAYLRGPPAML
ncbi:hypothetical protein JHJ32_09150 [Parapedobacter sp. ISTM3]|nr:MULTISPECIES: hypothetical protein [Parapedobacter]MBK1440150.1 hypothetical protein [Parapedobacter sp. ISTM3]